MPTGRPGRNHAEGSASATRPTAVATVTGALSRSASSAARAGPARLATLKVSASSAVALDSSRPPSTCGSCEVQPPATAGLNSPASTASATTAVSGRWPTDASTAAKPDAYAESATASSRPGLRARSSRAPNTGPPSAEDAVSPARRADAATGEPVTVSPSSSNAGPDSSSPVRASAAPRR